MKAIDNTEILLQPTFTNKKTLHSRFGNITINLDKKIYFHHGLLGLSSRLNFCLSNFEKSSVFKILQSLEDNNLAFMVLPIGEDEFGGYPIYQAADIKKICTELEIIKNNLVILLITTFSQTMQKNQILVNAQAPLIIDVSKQAGIQYVFHSDRYNVRYEIT